MRPQALAHLAHIASHFGWHGALSADYFYEASSGGVSFIDGNPRLVEPVNALLSGLNLAEALVRLSLGERMQPLPREPAGCVRTWA